MKPILLTINEACQALRIGRTALYAAIKSGALAAKKLGSRTLITSDELERFAQSLPQK
jgi:excisionase family DNA binding protein